MSNGYAKLKNDFWHSPKIMRALSENPAAVGYYVAGISYSSDNLTDGHLSETAVFYAMRVPDEIVEWLEGEGFWECLEDGGWAIHGYLEHQKKCVSRPPIPKALRQAVYERDHYTCQQCGATKHLSLDHIWPYSKGGPDTMENLQTLCRSCNSRKGARTEERN